MEFNWSDEAKEYYFQKAEQFVEDIQCSDLLKVNRNAFTVSKGVIRIHFMAFFRKGHIKRFNQIKKLHPCIKEIKTAGYVDEKDGRYPPIMLHSCIEFEQE